MRVMIGALELFLFLEFNLKDVEKPEEGNYQQHGNEEDNEIKNHPQRLVMIFIRHVVPVKFDFAVVDPYCPTD